MSANIRISKVVIDLERGSVAVELYPYVVGTEAKAEIVMPSGTSDALLNWAQSISIRNLS